MPVCSKGVALYLSDLKLKEGGKFMNPMSIDKRCDRGMREANASATSNMTDISNNISDARKIKWKAKSLYQRKARKSP